MIWIVLYVSCGLGVAFLIAKLTVDKDLTFDMESAILGILSAAAWPWALAYFWSAMFFEGRAKKAALKNMGVKP